MQGRGDQGQDGRGCERNSRRGRGGCGCSTNQGDLNGQWASVAGIDVSNHTRDFTTAQWNTLHDAGCAPTLKLERRFANNGGDSQISLLCLANDALEAQLAVMEGVLNEEETNNTYATVASEESAATKTRASNGIQFGLGAYKKAHRET
mmetsp:Transcript_17447/g.25200  ORF Transcript_17447/g.25200 Transcript_17447/m.25200 type:complete len:149 (+) Transcript_17447:243-689(+)